MTTSAEVRARLVEMLRRDLVGPLPPDVFPADVDLQTERLREPPSSWYLTGFIAPLDEGSDSDDLNAQEEAETDAGDLTDETPEAGPVADDDPQPETPSTSRRYLPASVGLTVLVPDGVEMVDVRVSWGDYVTEPPLPASILSSDDADEPKVEWRRRPKERQVRVPVPKAGKGTPILVPDSASEQRPGGALELQAHARPFTLQPPGEPQQPVRAISLFLVNRRKPARRKYADVAFAFQARLEVRCNEGLAANRDRTGYDSDDVDLRIADLHFRDEAEYAVGRNTSGAWEAPDDDGRVRRAWTDPLPMAEVERVAPNEAIGGVTFGMEALADAAAVGGPALADALSDLPRQYAVWITGQIGLLGGLADRRRETAERLVAGMQKARTRIVAGIDLLRDDEKTRVAFRIMNLAIARAARRRFASPDGDPDAIGSPGWRPFQLAFVLLNLAGLHDKRHADRELVDLLFFPTGGGKTEAYLGLAAFAIAHRRLSGAGVLGAGVTVIMRYTLVIAKAVKIGVFRKECAAADGHPRRRCWRSDRTHPEPPLAAP